MQRILLVCLAVLSTLCLTAQPAFVDHFDDETVSPLGDPNNYSHTEAGSDWTISGNAMVGDYEAVEYRFTDENGPITIDFAANGTKLFIRMKGDNQTWPVRIDLVDNGSGIPLVTNIAGITKDATTDYTVLEYNWTGNLGDAGYGGAVGCTPEVPCQVNATEIQSLLFYVNPAVTGFDGSISIDYISVGEEPGEDMGGDNVLTSYNNDFTDEVLNVVDEAGYTSQEINGEWILSGDANTQEWGAVGFVLNNEAGEATPVDFVANDLKLFVRARTDADDWVMRIDLQDTLGLVTNVAGKANIITSTGGTYEYNFNGATDLDDAGYGQPGGDLGCTPEVPCQLTPSRISYLLFYVNPGTVGFDGSVFIDWVSVGEALTTDVSDFAALDLLKVYPNPVSDQLGVEFDLPTSGQVSVNLFDALGRRVITQDLGQRSEGNNFYKMDVANLATGNYHLQVAVDGKPARSITVNKQ